MIILMLFKDCSKQYMEMTKKTKRLESRGQSVWRPWIVGEQLSRALSQAAPGAIHL
jgi:hypothetical protein